MPLPKITIITPSYNQGQYLEQTIDSVLSQNYPNLEYFVFDGGSTDNSQEIIKKYEKHISFWESTQDKGQSDAINKGLKRASGEIINWLNSDDYYMPNTLKVVATAFQMKPQTKVLLGRSRLFEDDKTLQYTTGTDVYIGNLAKTIGWARIDQPETFFHASAVKKMGYLDEDLHYLMDRDWWIKFLFHFGLDKIVETDELLVNFRLHEDSKTVSQGAAFAQDSYRYYANLAELHGFSEYAKFFYQQVDGQTDTYKIKNLTLQDKNLIEAILNYHILLRGEELYHQNQTQKAKQFLQKIKSETLAPEDQKHLRKLKFRNNYIPNWLIRRLRRH